MYDFLTFEILVVFSKCSHAHLVKLNFPSRWVQQAQSFVDGGMQWFKEYIRAHFWEVGHMKSRALEILFRTRPNKKRRLFSLQCPTCREDYTVAPVISPIERVFEAEMLHRLKDDNGKALIRHERGEYLLHEYVKQYARSLFGSPLVDKPHSPSGPDFRVDGSNKYWIEVELDWHDYFYHKHHLDPQFRKVRSLVTLDWGTRPDEKNMALLPRKIIWIDPSDYNEWRTSRSASLKSKEIALQSYVISIIAQTVWRLERSAEKYCGYPCNDNYQCVLCGRYPENLLKKAIVIVKRRKVEIS